MEQLSITDWRDALIAAANELATTSLGYAEGEILSTSATLPRIPLGSFVALTGERTSVQIGLAGSQGHCMLLARAMFCMAPEDEDLGDEDLADALGEMVNVLAGGVKIRLTGRVETLNIGLPIVVHGAIDVTKIAEVDVTLIRWETVEALVFLLRHRERG